MTIVKFDKILVKEFDKNLVKSYYTRSPVKFDKVVLRVQ